MKIFTRFRLWLAKRLCKKGVFYINGPDVLPAPLSQEIESDCIAHLDEEDARTTLIEHNLRLVVYIAKRFENTGTGIEDLISIGTVGIIKAISTFRAEKNIKLAKPVSLNQPAQQTQTEQTGLCQKTQKNLQNNQLAQTC